ncbi:MAG: NDP-sugar synthase [Candidatus Rokubacteria bacterium]|nr:NDP-sugar synthase [Candidatus Rokubacteria bacterium]
MIGGIIAAGEGRRLRAAGVTVPKPMVPVGGVPLVESVIGNFVAAGIRALVIILNEAEGDCAAWLSERFADLDLRVIVKTTQSSLESFAEITAAGAPGPMLVSTVDAWCRPEDFAAFATAAARHPAEATVLAVTTLVADEKPLWVTLGDGGRVRHIGGDGGDAVTAGLYRVSPRARTLAATPGLGRLREYLAWLVAHGEPVFAAFMPDVVDVDRPEDIALAESLLADGRRRDHN